MLKIQYFFEIRKFSYVPKAQITSICSSVNKYAERNLVKQLFHLW